MATGDLTAILLVVVGALGVGGDLRDDGALAGDGAGVGGEEWPGSGEAKFRLFRRGPFWWSGKGQVVYRVAARDEEGRLRHGWLRCGGWLLGVMEDKGEARWDG